MGYALVLVACINCHRPFGCNPHRVPSLMVNGKRQPLCEDCANKWNKLHPAEARPILEGAYQPVDEGEL